MVKPQPPLPQIFLDAAALISDNSHGSAAEGLNRIAVVWSTMLKHPVSPSEVAKLMIAFTLLKEANSPETKNRVNCAGYLALLDQIETMKITQQTPCQPKEYCTGKDAKI